MDIVPVDFLNRVIIFDYGTGCIPAGALCYCHRLDGSYYLVCFKEPILDRRNIKLHVNVVHEHGRIYA